MTCEFPVVLHCPDHRGFVRSCYMMSTSDYWIQKGIHQSKTVPTKSC